MTYRLFSPTELESALYNSISTTDRQTGKIFTSATKEIIKELFSRRRMKKIAEPEVSTIYDRFVKYICDPTYILYVPEVSEFCRLKLPTVYPINVGIVI